MVTKEELEKLEFVNEKGERKASYHVTKAEMKRFAVTAELNNLV